jgi:proline dehydrogenase
MSKKSINESVIKKFVSHLTNVLNNRVEAKKLVKSIAKKDKELAKLTLKVSNDMEDLIDYLERMDKKYGDDATSEIK